ncbi:hypothetical protein JRO89_XS03G0283000 [Xanthoceras sorbifolium]|uniref:Uncharacterized protein n=1 Tax=Xanthoceras sorbifolium TaxID=99658 RepID=A0ABQ8ICE9_9ROSI|nr:hypothetical protein JRO89_XS03G0283000 [Xanthoceras sorbifolium]
MAKLKIAGIWKGDLEGELEQWTIPKLRGGGKAIELLSQLGVKNNAKSLATRVSIDEGKSLVAEEERSRRLTRVNLDAELKKQVELSSWPVLKELAAAAALVERHADGSVPLEDFDIELEDQNGEKIRFGSETDRRAMMMGLMLHANAKKLIRRQLYKDALEVLTMGENLYLGWQMTYNDIITEYFVSGNLICHRTLFLFAIPKSLRAHEEFILIDCARFTSDVMIKSISVVGGADGTSPSKMRV